MHEAFADDLLTTADEQKLVDSFKDAVSAVTDAPIVVTSAAYGYGLPELAGLLRELVSAEKSVARDDQTDGVTD